MGDLSFARADLGARCALAWFGGTLAVGISLLFCVVQFSFFFCRIR